MTIKNHLAIGFITMICLLGASTAPAEAGCCKALKRFVKAIVKPVEQTMERATKGLGHAIEGTIEVAGDALEKTYAAGKSTAKGTISAVETVGNGLDAIVKEATGDRRAKEAWKRTERHLRDAGIELAGAVEDTVEVPFDALTGGVSVVRDDFAFTFVIGKHPDDVRAEIRQMVEECKARIAAQRELPDVDSVGKGELLPFPATFLSLAVAMPAAVLSLVPGSPELQKEYDAAVATCKRAYENERAQHINTLDTDAQSTEEKIALILSEKDAVLARLTAAVQQFWEVAKIRLAARFGRTISDDELQPRLSEHPDLVVDLVAFVQQERDSAHAALSCYDSISGDSELLRRFGDEDIDTLCREVE